MQIIALHNQSLIDIAIAATGKAENLLKIAMANNLVPTDPLVPGSTILIPDTAEIDQDIVRFYNANNIVPATALAAELDVVELSCEEKIYECFKD